MSIKEKGYPPQRTWRDHQFKSIHLLKGRYAGSLVPDEIAKLKPIYEKVRQQADTAQDIPPHIEADLDALRWAILEYDRALEEGMDLKARLPLAPALSAPPKAAPTASQPEPLDEIDLPFAEEEKREQAVPDPLPRTVNKEEGNASAPALEITGPAEEIKAGETKIEAAIRKIKEAKIEEIEAALDVYLEEQERGVALSGLARLIESQNQAEMIDRYARLLFALANNLEASDRLQHKVLRCWATVNADIGTMIKELKDSGQLAGIGHHNGDIPTLESLHIDKNRAKEARLCSSIPKPKLIQMLEKLIEEREAKHKIASRADVKRLLEGEKETQPNPEAALKHLLKMVAEGYDYFDEAEYSSVEWFIALCRKFPKISEFATSLKEAVEKRRLF